ncbi:MAG: D-2-hydroxyacid dehydrogenase [Anaerolineae bacterium]|nr:D-2-hydroxyacid dehydrogenase [Anaerolineae bacterium]
MTTTKDKDLPIHVIITVPFSDGIIEQLQAVSPRLHIERHYPNVPETAWANAEVLYTLGKYPDPQKAPRLRWIQMHVAGLDRVLKEPIIHAEDIEITSASGIHATQMAEYCLGMMLAFAYKLPLMLDYQKRAEWPEGEHDIFLPRGLRGLTLGIVGYGSIGRELARLADALGMTVLATKRDVKHPPDAEGYTESGTGDPEGLIPTRLYPPEALVSMAAACDFLVVTTPLTRDTHHMVNEVVFEAMRDTAFLVNVARGAVVDEAALISALAARKIAGAALDVFEEEPLPSGSPLWNLDNVILSPHVSGNSVSYHEKAAALFAENLQRYIEKRPLLNRLRRDRGY